MSTAIVPGRGWRFPPEPAPATGRLPMVDGPALVRQAILVLLTTEPGERVMRPAYGCPLRSALMSPNTPATRAEIAGAIADALARFEPRIRVRDVLVEPTGDPATVLVDIRYTHVRDGSDSGLAVPLVLGGLS